MNFFVCFFLLLVALSDASNKLEAVAKIHENFHKSDLIWFRHASISLGDFVNAFPKHQTFMPLSFDKQKELPAIQHEAKKHGNFLSTWVVHFSASSRANVKETNALIAPFHLENHIPKNAWTVVGPSLDHPFFSNFMTRLRAAPMVSVIAPLPTQAKMATSFESMDKSLPVVALLDKDFATHSGLVMNDFKMKLEEILPEHAIQIDDERFLISPFSTELVEKLSTIPFISWVEPKVVLKAFNKWARYVIQGRTIGETPLSDAGLTGNGQVIQHGDTGVDYDSCFFSDDNQTVPHSIYSGTSSFVPNVNPNHRKIVSYTRMSSLSAWGDEVGGHGTHTAGSVAGQMITNDSSVPTDYSSFNGMAPEAKLAVWDFSDPGDESLNVPSNLYRYYKMDYDYSGARLSTNSWGGGSNYDSSCRDTDEFVWDHPDFLPIYAAGNDGNNGYATVAAPSISKNCLCVGAAENAPESWQKTQFVFTTTEYGNITVRPANFGGVYGDFYWENKLCVNAVPSDACSTLTNPSSVSGKFVLIQSGGCDDTVKAKYAQAAGGLMAIIVTDYSLDDGVDPTVTIPVGALSSTNYTFINEHISTFLMSGPIYRVTEYNNEDHLAWFSSLGPTIDGRSKPDLTAPGQYVYSVKSDGSLYSNQCPTAFHEAFELMQGTSMATPIAAGGAALVRQFFVDGYYPTGSPIEANKLIPTAALIKAVMISSTTEMVGLSEGEWIMGPPSLDQGFGLLNLKNALPVQSSPSFTLQIFDNQEIAQGEVVTYCFQVDSAPADGKALIVTMAFSDYPGSLYSSIYSVHDLDLRVELNDGSSGKVWLGNQLSGNPSPTGADQLNNVEKVVVDASDISSFPAKFTVTVTGTRVIQNDTQAFALSVIAPSLTVLSNSNCAVYCPSDCSGHGTCLSNGECECSAGYTGAACQQEIKFLTATVPTSSEASIGNWQFFNFSTPKKGNIKVSWTTYAGYVNVFVGQGFLPNFMTFSAAQFDPLPYETTLTLEDVDGGDYFVSVYTWCCDSAFYDVEYAWTAAGHAVVPTLWIFALILILSLVF